MKSVAVILMAGCLSISCTFSGASKPWPPMVSVEHDEDFGPGPGDPMIDLIRRVVASRAASGSGDRMFDWTLGPDLTGGGGAGQATWARS